MKDVGMRDGLYRVQFETQLGSGSGYAALHNGTVCGGDRGMIYSGRFEVDGDLLSVTVAVEQRPDRKLPTLFGAGHAVISMCGRATPHSAELSGVSADVPDMLFQAHLTHIPD